MLKLLGKLFLVVMALGILAAVLTPSYYQSTSKPPQTSTPKVAAPTSPIEYSPETKKHIREQAAIRLENHFLDKGMDVHVTLSGKNKDVIAFRYALISRPLIHKLSKEGDLIDALKNMEFKKAVFTDGYDSTWTFDLTQ